MSASYSSKAVVFRAISQSRRTCKRFKTNRTIKPEILEDVLKSTLRSPSSFNLQPSQIIIVQSQEVKDRLGKEAMLGPGNQYRTRDCSAFAVFLSDLEAGKRIQRIYDLEKDWGKRHPTYLSMLPLTTSFMMGEGHAATLLKQLTSTAISDLNIAPMPQIEPIETWAFKNTSLLVQSYMLAASSHDLATSVMEGFDSRRMKEILRIPDRYGIPMVVATGYDYEEDAQGEELTPRLGIDEAVFMDTFGVPFETSNNDSEDTAESA